MTSPFHEGEKAVQEHAGVRARVEQMGQRIIRDSMAQPHRELFGRLPWLHVGSLDREGHPWASVLAGPPGFITTPDPHTLHVAARALPGDPLAENLRLGRRVGLVGLEPHTRRRNRANGRVVARDERGFTVRVEQSFGNCPKYIQARRLTLVPTASTNPAAALTFGPVLPEEARRLLRATDTLFLATSHAEAARDDLEDPARGVDVSHRGGRPGFVRVDEVDATGAVELTLPDFSGNFMFQSLGNLATEPRAGVVVLDFATGDVLSLAVTGRFVWDGPDKEAFQGAERVLHLRVEKGVWMPAACPLRGTAAVEAPELDELGAWCG